MRHRGPHGRRVRSRWQTHAGDWRVRARVERFGEPALLLLLRERPAHGYELLEQLPELVGGERIDMGNLYRVLRGLEDEGFVRSEWEAELLTYSQALTSMTGGRGDYHMHFLRYDEVPSQIAQKLIEAAKKEKEEVKV